jgi:hypothetical protein
MICKGKSVHSEPLQDTEWVLYERFVDDWLKAEGVYLVVVETEQERFVKKVMVD